MLKPTIKSIKITAFVDYTSQISKGVRDMLTTTIDELGDRAQFSYRFFPSPLRQPEGDIAAKAAIAAQRQGKFEEMHEKLLLDEAKFDIPSVMQLAEELKLDTSVFEEDLNSEHVQEQLEKDRAVAKKAQLEMTPGIVVNGHAYNGAWDKQAFLDFLKLRKSRKVNAAMEGFFSWGASAAFVLLIATISALTFVNLGFYETYEHIRDIDLGFVFGKHSFLLHTEIWINDAFMAIFFLLIGLEIKREIVSGELSDMSRAAMPVIGAIGGMFVPVGLYFLINLGGVGASGWGIPMATDIAFTLGLMALLGSRVPSSLKIFVSALAVSDDLGAILVIALFYGHGFHLDAFLISLGVLAVMGLLNFLRVYSKAPYLILGVILWYFIYESGLHATLAGVLTAALIPSRPSGDMEGVATQAAMIFEQEIAYAKTHTNPNTIRHGSLRMIQNAIARLREPAYYLEHELERGVNYLILPLFAFFNTGILIAGTSFQLIDPINLGVILGLCIGKPLGIVGACWLATKLKIASFSEELNWLHIIGAGGLAGVGFTMSIVVASAAFSGQILDTVKLSILIASAVSAILGLYVLHRATLVK